MTLGPAFYVSSNETERLRCSRFLISTICPFNAGCFLSMHHFVTGLLQLICAVIWFLAAACGYQPTDEAQPDPTTQQSAMKPAPDAGTDAGTDGPCYTPECELDQMPAPGKDGG